MGFMSLLPIRLRTFSLFTSQATQNRQTPRSTNTVPKGAKPAEAIQEPFEAATLLNGFEFNTVGTQIDLFCPWEPSAPQQADLDIVFTGTVKPTRNTAQTRTQFRAGSGRLILSGRMSDVCAELDRLIALEGLQTHLLKH